MLEALLSYWLSCFVLPSWPEGGLNSYVFPLAILITKCERLALAPTYLGSLYTRLDECLANIAWSLGCFYVVTHDDSIFLQMFMW